MNNSFRAIIVFCLAALICACEKEPVHVERLILDKEALTLAESETQKLIATASPANAEDKKVVWSSSDSSVADVSQDGIVTAIAPGTASIKATSDDRGITAVCIVTVVSRAVTGLTIDPAELTLKELEKAVLNVTITPDNAREKSIEWTSSDPEVASVSYGVVYALKAGEAVITAKNKEGDRSASCKVTVVCPVKGVQLRDHSITLKVKEGTTLSAEVYPERANDKSVTWTTDNSSVATVSNEGVVTGVASGSAKITIRTTDGDFTDECTVTVVSDVEGIKLNRTEPFELVVDETFDFVATIEPVGATNQAVNWSSTKPEIASIDDKGHVVALHAGETIICATSQDGGYHAFCTVKVRNKVDKIVVSPAKITLMVGGEGKTLTYTTSPADAGHVDIVWSSSKETVATVDQNGNVTPVGKGTAKIWASTANGDVYGGCDVTVEQPVTSIRVDIESEEMWTGESKDFTVTLEPDYASNLNYKVNVSSGNDVISTTQKGNIVTVKALKVGTAKIQFVPELPSSSDIKTECVITVKAHVSSVSIKGGDQNIDVGKTTTLEAIVSPNDADDKSVTWSVDNSEIATIDNSGKVTGVSPGTATVTVTTTDSGKTATCKITVNQPVDSVTLDKNTLTLTEGQSETLKATANPEQADQSFTWSSNNTSVATVDSNGKVTAVKAGTADITATSKSNPAKYTTCRVTVRPAVVLVSSITLDRKKLQLEEGQMFTLEATVLPENAANKKVIWSSSDESVATVAYGVVVAKAVGTCTVTCQSEGNPSVSATCEVEVSKATVAVSSISLSPSTLTLSFGSSQSLLATVSPSDATDPSITWKTSDATVATVSTSGRVTALRKEGTAVITATSVSDPTISATCTVTVKPEIVKPNGVEVTPRNLTLYVGQTKTLRAYVTPQTVLNPNKKDATDLTVIWQAAGGAVVSVRPDGGVYTYNNPDDPSDPLNGVKMSNGVISGLQAGSTNVTIFTSGREYQTSAYIKVLWNTVTSIELSDQEITLREGETFDLTARPIGIADPQECPEPSNPRIAWSSGDSRIATVNSNGRVTAVKAGEVSITVESADHYQNQTITAVCHVKVISSADGNHEGVGFDNWNY